MKRALTLLWVVMAAMFVCLSGGSILAQQAANRAADEEQEPPLVIRVYEVADLVITAPAYEFQGTQIPSMGAGTRRRQSLTFGGGGGGFGGGGGGGGFFQVRPEQLAQLGGGGGSPKTGGFGGGGGGGGGGFGGVPARRFTVASGHEDMDTLINAITTTVEPDTWHDAGGEGECVAFGSKLIISHWPEVHAKVEELLEALRGESSAMRTVTIEARWLALTSEQLDSVFTGDRAESGAAAGSVDRKRLSELASTVSSIRGRITCFDGQTVYLVSGRGRTKVQGAIPVVGSGAAYQAIITIPQPGALLQVTPRVIYGGQGVVLDLQSTVSNWGETDETVRLGGPRSSDDEEDASSEVDAVVIVDRIDITAQELATTLRVPAGEPVLVGGLSLDPRAAEGEGQSDTQLYLFVEAGVNGGGA